MTISRDMLMTSSSSDTLPLIPTAPLSSGCGMNGSLTIQRPPCEAGSFAWSDFPVIANDHFFPKLNTYHASSDSESSDTYMEDVSCSSRESFTSLSSCTQQQPSTSSSSSNHKRVKFAPMLEVRTHSVTLGDHPLCTILPVELDWGHADTEYVNLELHEMKRAYHGKARKLSYLERKRLLQEFVDEEMLQSTLQQQPHMKKGGLSSFQLTTMQ